MLNITGAPILVPAALESIGWQESQKHMHIGYARCHVPHTHHTRHWYLVKQEARLQLTTLSYVFQAFPTSVTVFLRNRWQDPFLEDIVMRCVCISSRVPSMVAAVFRNLPTCAHEILRRGSSSHHAQEHFKPYQQG